MPKKKQWNNVCSIWKEMEILPKNFETSQTNIYLK